MTRRALPASNPGPSTDSSPPTTRPWKRGPLQAGRLSTRVALVLATLLAAAAPVRAASFSLRSPDGHLAVTVTLDGNGKATYSLKRGSTVLLEKGALGITTSEGDFTSGLTFSRQARRVIRETYRLPVGKRSTYLNHASELELAFRKGARRAARGAAGLRRRPGLPLRPAGQRAARDHRRDDQLPGRRPARSPPGARPTPTTTGTSRRWGRSPPTGSRCRCWCSCPAQRHFLLVAQAASYGHYIIPNYQRQGSAAVGELPARPARAGQDDAALRLALAGGDRVARATPARSSSRR